MGRTEEPRVIPSIIVSTSKSPGLYFSRKIKVMPRQDGKVAIVTGGGRGIGYEVVRHMARLGAHVII
ncbi:hypothetical protein KUCAC02_010299, partial [Chaenocephalus aceratus]